MSDCITKDLLRKYLSGLVTPKVSHSLETHLQSCPECQSLVARFTPQPEPLLQGVRGAFGSSGIEQEPELVSMLAAIGEFRSQIGEHSSSTSATQAAEWPFIRDYQILKKLGEGGMGTVYLAMHTRLGKKVALKILKADLDRNPQAIARFKQEWLAVGKVDHPHIVRAHDAGDDNGTYFLAMEYIEGRDLGRHLQINGRLRVPQACEFIRQAALGLQHAHDHDMVHRDVKPSNLILSPSGVIKVLDLGLAQLQLDADDSNELTREGQLVGTWLYMAPEQLSPSRQADSRSDVFSLGVTFYSFLVGTLPLSRGQMATQLPSIGTQRGDVPTDVQELLGKMLATNPDERIQTMNEVAQVLENHAKVASEEFHLDTHTERDSITHPVPDPVPPPIPSDPPKTRVPDFLRRSWKHLAIAGVAAAALLLVVTNLLPKSKPIESKTTKIDDTQERPIPAYGTITIVADAKIGTDPTGMIAISKGDTKKTFPLEVSSDNQLPPGTYYLVSEHPDLQLVPAEIDVARGTSQIVAVKQQSPLAWLFPSLPDQPGAFLKGSGTLWMQGMGEKDGIREPLTYRIKLAMGDKAMGGQWMEVEVTTAGQGSDYKETGLLLVDTAEYARSKSLLVQHGWLTSRSPSIESRLEFLYGDDSSRKERPSRLAVEFSEDRDTIRERADDLKVDVPKVRLSVHDALILLFGAEFNIGSRVNGVREKLAEGSDRKQSRQQLGTLYCLVVRSDDEGEKYSYFRNDEVPFSIVKIKVNLPTFTAEFNQTAFGIGGTSPGAAAKLKAEVATFASLQSHWVHFDEASLPKAEGAMAKYIVTITRGGSQQLFDVSLRMGDAVGGGKQRSLEVMLSGTEFEEEAILQVEDARESEGTFSVKEGWIRSQGETFLFEPDGNRESLVLGFLKLGKKPTPSLLTIHDVLALMFGAKWKNATAVDGLRQKVSALVSENGSKRGFESETINTKYFGDVPCEKWTLTPKPPGLDYEFYRNSSYPFDFLKTTFNMGSAFSLTSELVGSKKDSAPSSLNFTATAAPSLQIATSGRVKAAEMEENWRDWAWSSGVKPEREWAEFRGKLKDGTVLLLCKRELPKGNELLRVKFNELRQDDQDWIDLPSSVNDRGRIWHAGGFKRQAAYVKQQMIPKEGKRITLKNEEEGEFPIAFDKLSLADQKWIDDLEKEKKNLEKPNIRQ